MLMYEKPLLIFDYIISDSNISSGEEVLGDPCPRCASSGYVSGDILCAPSYRNSETNQYFNYGAIFTLPDYEKTFFTCSDIDHYCKN